MGAAVKILILLLLALSLVACNPFRLCRDQALIDARTWECKGYPTRIAAYNVGGDGYLVSFPLSLYTHLRYGGVAHAQAQVYKNGRWWWVEGWELMEGPTYSTVRKSQEVIDKGVDYLFWSNHDFVEKLRLEGFGVPTLKPCK